MLKFIYRQRRRLLFGGLFATLSVIVFLSANLMYFDTGVPWFSIAALWITALVCGLIYMAVGAIYITLFRRWRQLVEMVPLILFINSLLGQILQSWFGVDTTGTLSSVGYFAICMLLYSLIYGPLLDRFPLFLSWEARSSFTSPRTADQLWSELVPGAAPTDQHWDKLLHDFEPDPEDGDSLELTYTHGHSFYQHQTITFLEYEEGHRARYYFVGDVDPKNQSLTEGTYALEITPAPSGGCRIQICETHTALLPRVGIMMWFDDALADSVDHIAAQHNDKRDWSISGLYRRTVLPLA